MATYNGSEITRGTPARSGVYPVKVSGIVNIGNVTIANNDTMPLCYIPFGCYLSNLFITIPIIDNGGSPTLNLGLVDTLSSATVYIATSTNKGTHYSVATNFSYSDIAANILGTVYGVTARSIGASGAPVVVWASGTQLILKAGANAANATGGTINIQYMLEWAPASDMGV